MEKNLFVLEEDGDAVLQDVMAPSIKEEGPDYGLDEEDFNDPVVREIPLNITHGPCPIHVLQYANKSKKLGKRFVNHLPVSQVRYKEHSSLLELDIPLNTDVFYNQDRAKEDWDDVKVQTLKGVGVSNEGQYVGLMHDGQLYLMPVEKVAQIRPYFKYIDQKQQQRKHEDANIQNVMNGASGTKQRAQVVTMSVKSSNEANQGRLGGSLLAHRIAEDEVSKELVWKEDTFESFLAEVTTEESREALIPKHESLAYLGKLL
ncbi:DNA-directed RNA polymerase III subunit C37 Ecym_6353 [Eremothecium cymbalariae DBVPG|uniref:DNA-directed RNA polymerase III subunit RPC5 n=1 Tax=Eremothecium cymbalariae (strain CBS 270.75 / DBVPG 7215 / KCTC 17166 / NRRL Y-17582) TaxID=931890 RepID=G8JUE9_ERECY|nr:hypothetical protein Ecym_6353 [Eremothecium cymbalariae DBVPG\